MLLGKFSSMFTLALVLVVTLALGVTTGNPHRMRRANNYNEPAVRELPPTFSVVQPEVFFVSYGASNPNPRDIKITPQTLHHVA